MKINLLRTLAGNLACRLTAFAIGDNSNKSKLITSGSDRSLYETPCGDKLWLNSTGYVDTMIIRKGIFEGSSTKVVKKLLRDGDVVLDVGANIGYYTIMASKIVGESGKVVAFEPTNHFRVVLEKNIKENGLRNVEVVGLGLSSKAQSLDIDIGPSSATLHSPEGFDEVLSHERIQLVTLDSYVEDSKIEKIDFIKIDVDGHEPLFFEGAWGTLDRFSPTVILELSHLHYLEAGVTAWDFYDSLRTRGYNCFDEEHLAPIESKEMFLRKCGNFDKSSNLVISKKPELCPR